MTAARIVGVAVIHRGVIHTLPAPNRHANVIWAISKLNKVGITHRCAEGFVDADGHFLTRLEAMARAKETGQLNRCVGVQFYQGPELYSEDLW